MGDTQEAFILCLKKPLSCCQKAAVVRTKPHVFVAPIIAHLVQCYTTGKRLWWGKYVILRCEVMLFEQVWIRVRLKL